MSDHDEWTSYSHWGMFHWNENPRCDQVQALNNIAAVD
ncbi:MAG: hypothetical protein JWR80_9634 [Bradyrhizobium sp.]|jgi:hypothetical protein|nr:hypothetical protein [Bradyrhizobium sp.]